MVCPFESYVLAVMREYVGGEPTTAKRKLCFFCDSLFSDTKTFNENLQEIHSLPPVTQIQNSDRKLPQASAFRWYSADVPLRSKRRS